jgi:ubiquinone/menaquinone biosynthesis C-methylase UbiE
MGRHSIFLAEMGFDVTATDISVKGVEETRRKAAELGLKIKTACHDMRDIPFTDGYFDAVFCVWTTGHGGRADMETHAGEMLRVTRPGGFIFADYVSKEDGLYGKGTEIEKDTFIDNVPGEESIPHHYTDERCIREIYDGHELSVKPYIYSYKGLDGKDNYIKALLVICKKEGG